MRVLVIAVLVCMAGCAGSAGSWTAHWPDGGWGRAAGDALRDPHTWVPLVGAALLAASDVDDEVSEDAVEDSPLFSDPQGSSSDLRDAAAAAYLITALAAPSDSVRDKAAGLAAGLGATVATSASIQALKGLTGRERPVDDNSESFPSGHTGRAAVLTRLAQHNLGYIDMPAWQRRSLAVGFTGIAIGAGWARIEAGKHFPTDVLVGYAIGSFFAALARNAMMDDASGVPVVGFAPVPGGGMLTVTLPLR